jgi:hypothetical protein
MPVRRLINSKLRLSLSLSNPSWRTTRSFLLAPRPSRTHVPPGAAASCISLHDRHGRVTSVVQNPLLSPTYRNSAAIRPALSFSLPPLEATGEREFRAAPAGCPANGARRRGARKAPRSSFLRWQAAPGAVSRSSRSAGPLRLVRPPFPPSRPRERPALLAPSASYFRWSNFPHCQLVAPLFVFRETPKVSEGILAYVTATRFTCECHA